MLHMSNTLKYFSNCLYLWYTIYEGGAIDKLLLIRILFLDYIIKNNDNSLWPRIYLVTWNVGTKSPDQSLHNLLSLDENPAKDTGLLPDLYVISLQEVKAQPHNMLVDILFDDPWTNACREVLERRDYVKVKTIRLQGLVLSVYCLRRHLLNLREIETQYTRTGISGFWVNCVMNYWNVNVIVYKLYKFNCCLMMT